LGLENKVMVTAYGKLGHTWTNDVN